VTRRRRARRATPGLGRQPTSVWQTYQDRKGGVIYGGRPLGKAPQSKPYRVKR